MSVSVLQAEGAHISRLSMKREMVEKTYVPFKTGKIVNGVPVWLEAQIPYSTNLEEMLHIHEMLKNVFSETVKLLAEKLSTENSFPNKASSTEQS